MIKKKKCELCGTKMVIHYIKRPRNKKYCSDHCRREVLKEYVTLWKIENPEKVRKSQAKNTALRSIATSTVRSDKAAMEELRQEVWDALHHPKDNNYGKWPFEVIE